MKTTTIIELAGACSIGIGLYQMYAPLAPIWIGVVCFTASFLSALEAARQQQPAAPAAPAPVQPMAHDDGGFVGAEVRDVLAGERREPRR